MKGYQDEQKSNIRTYVKSQIAIRLKPDLFNKVKQKLAELDINQTDFVTLAIKFYLESLDHDSVLTCQINHPSILVDTTIYTPKAVWLNSVHKINARLYELEQKVRELQQYCVFEIEE